MSSITITVNTDNAAFEPSPLYELAHILRTLASRFEERDDLHDIRDMKLRDANGNTVGGVTLI